jgi:predicted MFS family arabinose efflux permease
LKSILHLYQQAYTGITKPIWILAIVQFINRVGSMLIIFLGLFLTNELKFTFTQTSFVLSMYGVGGIAGNLIGGKLADKFHYRKIMIGSLLASSVIMFLIIYVSQLKGQTTFYGMSILVLLYALIADSFRPANSVATAALSTDANRMQSFSLVRMTINLAFAVAPAIGGILASKIGYKALFALDGGTTILAALFLWWQLPFIAKPIITKDRADSSKGSAYKNPVYLQFIFLVMLYGTLFFQLLNTMPVYFNKVSGFSEHVIGWLLALNGAIVVLVEMPLITHLSKDPFPIRFIRIGVLCLLLSFLCLIFSPSSLPLAIGYFVLISFSEIFAMPFMMNYAISIAPKERQGEYTALYSIAYATSFIIAPIIGLRFADAYGFNTMLYLFMALSIICLIGFSFFTQRYQA